MAKKSRPASTRRDGNRLRERNAPASAEPVQPREPGLSEYEQLINALAPAFDEVPPAELTDPDITFLADKTGVPVSQLKTLRTAARNAPALLAPTEAVYALLRRNVGGDVYSLVDFDRKRLAATLTEAAAEGIIPPVNQDAIDRMVGPINHARGNLARVSTVLSQVKGGRKLSLALARAGIRTFDELKSPKGFQALTELEAIHATTALDRVRAHVNLSVLVPDATTRATIIDLDYRSVSGLASTTVSEFLAATDGRLGAETAVTLHTQAVVLNRIVQQRVIQAKVDTLLVIPPADPQAVAVQQAAEAEISCTCNDCESAVSPRAYLADLLHYCYDYVRDSSRPPGRQRVDYRRLGQELHQPLADLPAQCGAVEESVHQVRIAVEVLRSYLSAHLPAQAAVTALLASERDYARAAYDQLLVRVGTSYTDLRLAVVGPQAAQDDLADRLGVRRPTNAVNRLRDLLLDVSGATPAVLEQQLEARFGLRNTRSPVSAVAPAPSLLTWRREKLRDTWFAQDWPEDPFTTTVPAIDPDVIGPDDFRTPDRARGAFEIWVRRRQWVDSQVSSLLQRAPAANASQLDAMLDAMYSTGNGALSRYPLRGGALSAAREWPAATPKDQLLGFSVTLRSGSEAAVVAATRTLASTFGLEVDAFNRLAQLVQIDAAFRADGRNPPTTAAEVREFASILGQARKAAHTADWVAEEQAALQSADANVTFEFGPRTFWISLAEPDAGEWPPVDPDARTPWLDPDLVALNELPEPPTGSRARTIWNARAQVLSGKRALISTAIAAGMTNALTEALGAAVPGAFASWGGFVDDTLQKLGSTTAGENTLARQRLETELFMSEEVFGRFMTIRSRDASADPSLKPTAAEYAELELLLLTSWKRRDRYPAWRNVERQGGQALADWEALRIKTPQWRASAEQRSRWQTALRGHGAAPLVDPDLIDERHLVLAVSRIPAGAVTAAAGLDERASRLWRDRAAEVAATLTAIRTAREQAANTADSGLTAAMSAAGVSIDELNDLVARAAQGLALTARLAQATLDAEAFQYLSGVSALIAANQNVDAPEWTEVYSILLGVWKRRNARQWRDAERLAGLSLSPDALRVPPLPTESLPPAVAEPPRWRASVYERQAWEDRLQARIDQNAGVATALRQAVDATEEATLPALRDALITALDVRVGTVVYVTLAQKAKVLGDRLLIELKGSGCATTTRIAQAIETLQNLLFSIRTGRLLEIYPTWRLTNEARAAFDGVWLWLGSFLTWRSAMFVIFYPENLAIPALRREGTPAFWTLLGELRSAGTLSGRTAEAATAGFVSYLRDICQLDISTSPQVTCAFLDQGVAFPSGITTNVRFLFGVSRQTRRLYWSLIYRGQGTEQQSGWRRFTQFTKDIKTVVGASAYAVAGTDKRYLYVFVVTTDSNRDELFVSRFDLLGEGRWLPAEADQLEVRDATRSYTHFSATLLETDENTAPAVEIRPVQGTPFKLQLGVDGTATGVQVTPLTPTVTWGTTRAESLIGGDLRVGGGVALRRSTATTRDLVFFVLSNYRNTNDYYGEIRIGQGFSDSGAITTRSSWTAVGEAAPNGQPAWIFGIRTPVANRPTGAAIAIADVDGDGQDDLVIVWVHAGNAGNPSSVSCGIGLGLRADGTAQQWVVASQDMISDAPANSGPCAVTFVRRAGGGFDLVVVGAGGTDRKSIWARKVTVTPTAGNTDLQFTDIRTHGSIPDAADKVLGLGLAIEDLDGDGSPDILLHYVEKNGTSVAGWLRYASALDTNGFPTGQWSVPVAVSQQLYQPVAPGSFADPADAGLALFSPSPGRIDAVLATFPATSAPNGFQYLVASNVNLRLASAQSAGINVARYKPALVPPGVPATFDYHIGVSRSPGVNLTAIWNANRGKTRINQALLDEAFVFAPIAIAMELQRAGDYLAALDWFRLVYDFARPRTERVLYPGLEPNPGGPGIWRDGNWAWLADPLDPHSIARGRTGTYKRFVFLSLIRCLLEYGDAEFTLDTAESVPVARVQYLRALDLLDDPDLAQRYDNCEDVIGQLWFFIGELDDRVSRGTRGDVFILAENGANRNELKRVAYAMEAAYERGYMTDAEAAGIHQVSQDVVARVGGAPRSFSGVFEQQQTLDDRLTHAVLSDPRVGRQMLEANIAVAGVLEQRFGRGGNTWPTGGAPTPQGLDGWLGSIPEKLDVIPFEYNPFDDPRIIPSDPIPNPNLNPVAPVLSIPGCIVPNPVLKALRLRAELNLRKIATCRSITGERRQVDPYAAPTGAAAGIPSIGAGGQLVIPGLTPLAPTPYRFSVLIERARSLVQLAQQTENAMLAARQSGDAERYTAMKARQDLDNARAVVKLQTLRIQESRNGIGLTQLQQDRAQLEIDQYSQWLSAGMNTYETAALVATGISAAMSLGSSAAGFAFSATGGASAGFGGLAQAASSIASIFQSLGSFERQRQQWTFQRTLAQQDLKIAAQQYRIANDQLQVVTQEQAIASLTEDHATTSVEFLARKFTNTDLYDWMSDVLSGVYRYFLQQATGTARLAQAQLAFERQEPPPPFIQADYWTAPTAGAPPTGEQRAPDRGGLTGSARLLQDITQLDQYAFSTDRRELQLSKTISLCALNPLEFQRFRDVGVMTFATPLELFDRDFPGHYRRLIRRVRMSVLALTPPSIGIRATLTANRISRVVIGGDTFQTVRVSHGPETIALSSPRDATGLFELDAQPQMRGPFERIGVDTTWQLRMPRAANPFEFASIADVLMTIEYTALHSFDYQEQLLLQMNPRVSARRAWSFRYQFADQWYDLHNPALTPSPMKVQFVIRAEDFPANMARGSLAVDDIVLHVVRRSGLRFELPAVDLRLQEEGRMGSVGGTAGTVDGTIATSSGMAASWSTIQSRSPLGRWELSLPDTEEIRNRFASDDIEDVLLILTYTGRLPEWPA